MNFFAKGKIKKTIATSVFILAMTTYLFIVINGYYNYQIKQDDNDAKIIQQEITSISEKVDLINKFSRILDIRLKYINLISNKDSSPKQIIEIQNVIKELNILGEESGLQINIIEENKKRVLNGNTVLGYEFINSNLIKNFLDGKVKYNEFTFNSTTVAVFKKMYFSEGYPVMILLKRDNFFGTSDNFPIFIKTNNGMIGLEKNDYSKIKGEKTDFEYIGNKFQIIKKRDLKKEILTKFVWFVLPIFPIVLIYLYLYKLIIKYLKNRVKEFLNKTNISDYNEEDEQDYLENLYEKVVERNKFLLDKIKEIEKSFEEHMLNDYLNGLIKYEELDERVKIEKAYFGIIEILTYGENIDEIYYIISKIKSEMKIINIKTISLDQEKILLFSENEFKKEDIEKIIVELNNEFNIGIFCYLENELITFKDIPKKKKNFEKKLEFRDKVGTKRLIEEKDIKELNLNYNYFYPINVEQKMVNKINSLDLEGLKEIVTELFEENFYNRSLNIQNLNRVKRVLINSFEKIIMYFEISEIFNIEKEYFEKRELIPDEKYIELTYKICEKILEQYKITINGEDNLENKINKYIEENYFKEISLNDFAEYLEVTPQYASSVYKKIMGTTFNIALNKYRVEKSVEIFHQHKGNIKIKVLGEKVGFPNPVTFINNFKKIYGISPGKYFGIGE